MVDTTGELGNEVATTEAVRGGEREEEGLRALVLGQSPVRAAAPGVPVLPQVVDGGVVGVLVSDGLGPEIHNAENGNSKFPTLEID